MSALPEDERPGRYGGGPAGETEQLAASRPATPPGPPPPARPQVAYRPPPSAVLARRAGAVAASAVLWAIAGVLVGVAALLMLLDLDGVRRAVQTVVDSGFA